MLPTAQSECVGNRTAQAVADIANERESKRLGYPVHRQSADDMLPILSGLLDGLHAGTVPDEHELAWHSLRNPFTVAAAIGALPGAIALGEAPEFMPYAHLFPGRVDHGKADEASVLPEELLPPPTVPKPDSTGTTQEAATARPPADSVLPVRVGIGIAILAVVSFVLYRTVR